MGLTLPGGFSPMNALRTYADKTNIFDGTDTDYDIFSNISVAGGDRSPANGGFIGPQNQITAVEGRNTQNQPVQNQSDPYNESQAQLGAGGGGVFDAQAAQRATETADAIRAYNDRETQLRALLGRTGNTRTQVFSKIGDEYNANKTTGLAGYDEQRTLNTKDRLSNVDRVNQKAQSGYNSLQRILGMSGSANQSAKLGIGQAVAKVASQDRAGVFDTAGNNERGIELAQNTWLTDLNKRKADAEYNAEQDIYANEQDIYGELANIAGQRAQAQGGNYDAIRGAQAPFQAEITNRDNILAGLFDKYRPTLNAVAERPELGKYSVDRAAVQANQQQPGDYSPYSQLLRRRITEA